MSKTSPPVDQGRRMKTFLMIAVIMFVIIFPVRWWLMSQPDSSTKPSMATATEITVAVVATVLFAIGMGALVSWLWKKTQTQSPSNNGGDRSNPANPPTTTPTVPPRGDEETVWSKVSMFLGIPALLGSIIVALTMTPTEVRNWLWTPTAGLIALIIVAVIAFATKDKENGAGSFFTVMATLALVVALGFLTYSWWPTPIASGAGKATTGSRVTSKIVVAKPGVYSDEVSIPGGQNFNIQPQGKIRARTASGKIIDDWPGRHAEMEHGRSLLDGVFQFMSLEEKEVEVVVEWEPK